MASVTASSSFDSPLTFDRFLRAVETVEASHIRKSSITAKGKMKIPFDPRMKPTSESKSVEIVNRTILLSTPIDSVAFKAIFNEFAKVFNVVERRVGKAVCLGIYANDFKPEIKGESRDELLNLVIDPTTLKRSSPPAQPSTPPSRPRGKSNTIQVQKVALPTLSNIEGHSPLEADAAKEFIWSLRNTQDISLEKKEILKEIYAKFDVNDETTDYILSLEAFVPRKGYVLTLSNPNDINDELNDELNPYKNVRDLINRMILVDSDEVQKWADLQLGRDVSAPSHARSYSSGSRSPLPQTPTLGQPNSPSSSKPPLGFPRMGSVSVSSPATPTVRSSLTSTPSLGGSNAVDPISLLAQVTKGISTGVVSRRSGFAHTLTISTERLPSSSPQTVGTPPINRPASVSATSPTPVTPSKKGPPLSTANVVSSSQTSPSKEAAPVGGTVPPLTRPSSTSITSPVKKGPPPLPPGFGQVPAVGQITSESSSAVASTAIASVSPAVLTTPTQLPMPKRLPPPLPNTGAGTVLTINT